MKIKFLKPHPEMRKQTGDLHECDEYDGVVLIAAGYAEEVKESSKPTKAAPENAQDKA